MKILVFILFLLVAGREVRAALPPNEECEGLSLGDKVKDPADCQKYYLCEGDGDAAATPEDCDPGKCFDDGASDCTDVVATCESICAQDTPPCNLPCGANHHEIPDDICGSRKICRTDDPNSETYPVECPSNKPWFNGFECGTEESECCDCQLDTCGEGIRIADPLDCRSYYICQKNGFIYEPSHSTYPCDDGKIFVGGQCVDGTDCEPKCHLAF